MSASSPSSTTLRRAGSLATSRRRSRTSPLSTPRVTWPVPWVPPTGGRGADEGRAQRLVRPGSVCATVPFRLRDVDHRRALEIETFLEAARAALREGSGGPLDLPRRRDGRWGHESRDVSDLVIQM